MSIFFLFFYFIFLLFNRIKDPLISDLVVPKGFLRKVAIDIPEIVNYPVSCKTKNESTEYVVLMKSMLYKEKALREAQRNYLKKFLTSIEEDAKLTNETIPIIKFWVHFITLIHQNQASIISKKIVKFTHK